MKMKTEDRAVLASDGGVVINVDLDDVVYPFWRAFADYLQQEKELCPPLGFRTPEVRGLVKPTQWEFWRDWGMVDSEWMAWFRKGVEDGFIWWEGAPEPGAREALWRLSEDGFHIRIVTHRLVHSWGHRQAVQATAHWLDEQNIPYRSLALLGSDPKGQIKGLCLVDDNLLNIHEYTTSNPKSWGLVMQRPWSLKQQALLSKSDERWTWCKDWEDIEAGVRRLNEQRNTN